MKAEIYIFVKMKRFIIILPFIWAMFACGIAAKADTDSSLDSLYGKLTESRRGGFINQGDMIMALMRDEYRFDPQMSYDEVYAVILDKYVDWYRSRGDFLGRLTYLRDAEQFYCARNDSMNMARVHHTLGTTYQMLGIYDKAIESYNLSSEILAAMGGDGSQMRYRYTLNNIAALLYEENELDKCEELYLKCLSLINEMEDETRNEIDRSTYLGNIAMVYNRRAEIASSPDEKSGYLDKALEYSREASAIAKEYCDGTDREVEIVKREITLARALMLSGKFKEAERILKECDGYIDRNALDYQRIQVIGVRAEIETLEGNTSKAEAHYLEVLDYSKHMGLKEMESQTRLCLYDLLKDSQPKKALGHYVRRSEIRDSVFTDRQNVLISDFEVQYRTQEKEKLLEQRETQIRQGKVLLCALAAVLLLCIGAALGINHYRLVARKQNALLKEANGTKDKMISIISHDLKNPTIAQRNAIRSLASNYRTLDEGTLYSCLNELLKSSESQLLLLSNLLDWARLQTGRISCKTSVFSLSSIITNELKTVKKMADNKVVSFSTDLVDDDEVYADRAMVSIVFRNLITNAVKFSKPNTEIRIETGISGDKVSCSVIDHGIGMDEIKAGKLFSTDENRPPMDRADDTGTGIGLELCRSFISMNKGSIEVKSKDGEGSTFTFLLNRPESI